jgi:tRNA A37 N6-isopentenylltransferase MiaA
LPAFSAIGYHESWAFLDGARTLEEAIALDALHNEQFAKRQKTWFRREPALLVVDATTDPGAAVVELVERWLADAAGRTSPPADDDGAAARRGG